MPTAKLPDTTSTPQRVSRLHSRRVWKGHILRRLGRHSLYGPNDQLRRRGAGWFAGQPQSQAPFVRDTAGDITIFDGPGATLTVATGINDNGVIVGEWTSPSHRAGHGFMRDAVGNVTSFSAPFPKVSTIPYSINHDGRMIGIYALRSRPYHASSGRFSSGLRTVSPSLIFFVHHSHRGCPIFAALFAAKVGIFKWAKVGIFECRKSNGSAVTDPVSGSTSICSQRRPFDSHWLTSFSNGGLLLHTSRPPISNSRITEWPPFSTGLSTANTPRTVPF